MCARRALVGCLVAAVLVAGAVHHAEAENDRRRATRLYREATRLLRKGKLQEAIEKLEESHTLRPHRRNLKGIADAHRRLGKLRLSHHFLEQYIALLEPRKQRRLRGKLQQLRWGSSCQLAVSTVPGGARVSVNDKDSGRTPADGKALSITIPGGNVQVTVELPGYRPATREVGAEYGEPLALGLVLERLPKPTVLHVASSVSGAQVTLDGRPVGRTPLRLEVEPGVHRVVVASQGYREVARQIRVEPGKETRLRLALGSPLPSPPRPPEVRREVTPARRDEAAVRRDDTAERRRAEAGAAPKTAPRPQAPGPAGVFAFVLVGPALTDYGDARLERGFTAEFGLQAGYAWRWQRIGVHLGIGALYAPLLDRPNTEEKRLGFLAFVGGGGLRVHLSGGWWLGAAAFAGSSLLLGADEDSFLYRDPERDPAGVPLNDPSGVALVLRPELTLGWTVSRGLTVILAPAMDYSPNLETYGSHIRRIMRFHVALGVGWLD
jgi:hypothetical protein